MQTMKFTGKIAHLALALIFSLSIVNPVWSDSGQPLDQGPSSVPDRPAEGSDTDSGTAQPPQGGAGTGFYPGYNPPIYKPDPPKVPENPDLARIKNLIQLNQDLIDKTEEALDDVRDRIQDANDKLANAEAVYTALKALITAMKNAPVQPGEPGGISASRVADLETLTLDKITIMREKVKQLNKKQMALEGILLTAQNRATLLEAAAKSPSHGLDLSAIESQINSDSAKVDTLVTQIENRLTSFKQAYAAFKSAVGSFLRAVKRVINRYKRWLARNRRLNAQDGGSRRTQWLPQELHVRMAYSLVASQFNTLT